MPSFIVFNSAGIQSALLDRPDSFSFLGPKQAAMKITMEFEINDNAEIARLVALLQAMKCVLIRITAFVHLPESGLIPCVELQAHGGDNATGAGPEPW